MDNSAYKHWFKICLKPKKKFISQLATRENQLNLDTKMKNISPIQKVDPHYSTSTMFDLSHFKTSRESRLGKKSMASPISPNTSDKHPATVILVIC